MNIMKTDIETLRAIHDGWNLRINESYLPEFEKDGERKLADKEITSSLFKAGYIQTGYRKGSNVNTTSKDDEIIMISREGYQYLTAHYINKNKEYLYMLKKMIDL